MSMIENLVARFDHDIGKVTDDRGSDYGHPADNFNRAERLQQVVEECKDFELRHALRAILVKVARLVLTPTHYDSWLDIAGYVKCAIMILERRRQNSVGRN